MAISLATDIVLDVARAAEPAALKAAREKLASSASVSVDATFDKALTVGTARVTLGGQAGGVAQDPGVRFEGMVLRSFIEAMMPNDAQQVYGKGLAGDMWKSMLAEKVAEVVAAQGDLGIANRLLKDFVTVGEEKNPITGITDLNRVLDEGRPADAAQTLVNETQRDFLSMLDDKWGTAKDEKKDG